MLNVTFQGESISIKPTKTFESFKKELMLRFTKIKQQSWDFFYQDVEDEMQMQVEDKGQYDSMLDILAQSKANIQCEIKYKSQSQLEQSRLESDQSSSNNSSEESDQQKLSNLTQAKPRTIFSRYSDRTNMAKTQFDPQQDLENQDPTKLNVVVKDIEPKPRQSIIQQNPQSQLIRIQLSPEQLQQNEPSNYIQPYKTDKQANGILNQPAPEKINGKNEIQQDLKSNKSTEQLNKPIIRSEPKNIQPQIDLSSLQKDNYYTPQQTFCQPQIKNNQSSHNNDSITFLNKKPIRNEEQNIVKITIQEFEKYKNLERENQAIKSQLRRIKSDRSESKRNTPVQKCTFCCGQDHLNYMPLFENILICDICNQKFEITNKVKPYRSQNESSSSSQRFLR